MVDPEVFEKEDFERRNPYNDKDLIYQHAEAVAATILIALFAIIIILAFL